jgi:phage-related baseplate assembly protein
LDQVYAACNADKRRPIGDLVQPASPIAVNYDIDVDIVLYNTADLTSTLAQLQTLAEAYRDVRRAKLGRDFTRDQLKGQLVIPNKVYSIVVNQPAADSVLTLQQYAECGSININITGVNNG